MWGHGHVDKHHHVQPEVNPGSGISFLYKRGARGGHLAGDVLVGGGEEAESLVQVLHAPVERLHSR